MSVLQIWLAHRPVGQLWRDQHGYLFRFEEAYLQPHDGVRPVLGQWFEDRLQGRKAYRKKALHPWFQNVIPEPRGALRERICSQLALAADDDVGLLVALGDRLPGAARISPIDEPPIDGEVIQIPEASLSPALRTSLGGIQLKFTLSGSPERLSIPVSSADERWILKIAGPEYPLLAENEAAIMRWCAAAGFEVPDVRVIDRAALPEDLGRLPDTPTALLIRRFDRMAGSRVHQEDFAQVCGVAPEAKYTAAPFRDLAKLTAAILGPPGLDEFVRRLTAMVATGNADAHLKNWSLIYRDGITAEWSPLYDQVATVAYPRVDREVALPLGNARYFAEVDMPHIAWVAQQGGMGRQRADLLVEETISALRSAYDPEAFGLPRTHRSAVESHWKAVPLLRRFTLGRPQN